MATISVNWGTTGVESASNNLSSTSATGFVGKHTIANSSAYRTAIFDTTKISGLPAGATFNKLRITGSFSASSQNGHDVFCNGGDNYGTEIYNRGSLNSGTTYSLDINLNWSQLTSLGSGKYGVRLGAHKSSALSFNWTFTNISFTIDYTAGNTVTFKDYNGTVVKTQTVGTGQSVTAPTVSRSGYTFVGWVPSAQGVLCDSTEYNGNNCNVIARQYFASFTDKITVHVEAYMTDWKQIVGKQIISCTEGGGFGIGYQANTVGHGTEIYTSGYNGIDFNIDSLSAGWHSFDMVFSAGNFQGYVDGVQKGNITTSGTAITYNSTNAVFVGAEAGSSATSPAGTPCYFTGLISNVFIEHSGERLAPATGSITINSSVTFYPVYRKNVTAPAINSVTVAPSPATLKQGIIIAVSVT